MHVFLRYIYHKNPIVLNQAQKLHEREHIKFTNWTG